VDDGNRGDHPDVAQYWSAQSANYYWHGTGRW
jgi:hypothetical protein